MFNKRKDSGSPYGCADAAPASNVYEVNPWLWQFGRGKPRLGGLTIEETSERKDAVSNARHKRAAEIVRHRLQRDSKYTALYNRMYEYERVYTSMYEYIRVYKSVYQYNQGLQLFMICTYFVLLSAPKYNVLCLGDVSVHL
jgi:hypothetical protein